MDLNRQKFQIIKENSQPETPKKEKEKENKQTNT